MTKNVLYTLRIVAIIFSILLMSGTGSSQQPAAEPKIDWAMFLPPGEGQFQTAAYCPICHSLQPIVGNRRADEAGWLQTVQTMAYTNGAPVEDADIPVIAKYLAQNFGPSTPKLEIPINVNSAAKEILALIAALSPEDVQKILDARAKEKIKDFAALEAIVGSGKLGKYKAALSF